MKIFILDDQFITGLEIGTNVNKIWVEVDDKGFVFREIGFDKENEIVHLFPGKGKYGRYGIIEHSQIISDSSGDIEQKVFNKIWNENYSKHVRQQ